MFGILANDKDASLAADGFAMLTNFFYGSSYFHAIIF
jgi:hypothetical protein